MVSLPLSMAFAIASGLGPEKGLFTAIIAGFCISLFGGSRVQVSGPAGAFVVIIFDIVQRHGYEGLALATLLAALILIVVGLCRLGALIKYIPSPLIAGLTAGLGILIFSSQIKDFFGLKIEGTPVDFLSKWGAYFQNFNTWEPASFFVALSTLGLVLFIRRFIPFIPWAIGSIAVMTAICWGAGVDVATVGSRFGELPRLLPLPSLPNISFDWTTVQQLIPAALIITLLAGIESLLTAVMADEMTEAKHRSNCELVALGLGNLGSIIFGGMPATGTFARTALNVKSGAVTPLASMIHAVTLFLCILLLAPVVSLIPLPALSAVLITVAWNMCEFRHLKHHLKAPLGDVVVLLATFLLTILADLTVAVEVGIVLAALLFMKRMSSIANIVSQSEALFAEPVPAGVEVYEINGPFFFGVSNHLKGILDKMERPPKVFILHMRKVPVLDASGLHALKEFHRKCNKSGTQLILLGIHGQPEKSINRYGLREIIGENNIHSQVDVALVRAKDVLKT